MVRPGVTITTWWSSGLPTWRRAPIWRRRLARSGNARGHRQRSNETNAAGCCAGDATTSRCDKFTSQRVPGGVSCAIMSDLVHSVELSDGALFADRYRIVGILGRGGMGVVYRAIDLTLGEEVALKLVSGVVEGRSDVMTRFRQEVRLSRRVTHPNVIRVHDLGEQDQQLYMTMEVINGPTLRTILRNQMSLPLNRAIEIARTMATALSAAHAVGVIHRDLKPTNVLIDSTGRVVLTDFGIARFLYDDRGLTDGIIGTMSYMAPEQMMNGLIDERTDLYSLGVVFHEMLLGVRPSGPMEHIAARLSQELAKVPPRLAMLLMSCLAIDADLRPSSAAEFIAVLDTIHAGTDDVTLDVDTTLVSHNKTGPLAVTPRKTIPPVPIVEPPSPKVTIPPITPPVPSTPPPPQKLAVLPCRYRGPAEHEYLADVLTDELVDAISRIRGLLVFGSGATERFRTTRDPATIGQTLGAPVLIDGTVQAMGDRVRVAVRLVETSTGLQKLALQYDGRTSEIFEFQESVVRRVAEEMRVEIVNMAHADEVPSEAVDLYLEARRELRNPDPESTVQAVTFLDRAVDLAPSFGPALAAHAFACTRAWFLHMFGDRQAWYDRALTSVSRAGAYANHIAETHLAEGSFRANSGDYRAAAASLKRALEFAPGCPAVHEYIGMLQCEAGHIKKGLEHLELAAQLDPSRPLTWGNVARIRSLSGNRNGAIEALQRLEALERPDRFQASVVLRIRDALWHKDPEALDQSLLVLEASSNATNNVFFQMYVAVVQGYDDAIKPLARYPSELPTSVSPRFKMATYQWVTEALLAAKQQELALETLCSAATSVLVDLYWLEKCPLLGPLRDDYAFLESVRLTRERAAAITPF